MSSKQSRRFPKHRDWRAAFACESGNTIIFAAGLFMTLIVLTAMATDIGSLFFNRRELQAATDAAALAAALNNTDPSGAAAASMTSNGFGSANLVSVTSGQYQEDTSIPPADRFTASTASSNAVQVQTTMQGPLYFLRAILPETAMTISATAIGVRSDVAAFTAGTGVAALNGGIANAILGKMLGTSISLSAVSYQGLVNTSISAVDFINSLATQLNLTAGTYNQVLSAQVTAGQVFNAALSAAATEGLAANAASAYNGLQTLASQVTGGQSFPLSSLLSLDFAQGQQVGSLSSSTPGTASVNLYQLVNASAQLANGSNAVAATAIVNLPGLATADLYMTMIEPAQPAAPIIEYGPVGTMVHTAQVRLLLTIHLLNSLSVLGQGGVVTIPVYMELGSGNATLDAINCSSQPATDATVTIAAQPSLATVYIAQINPSVMTDFTHPVPTGTPATLVSLGGLASITGKATLDLGSGQATDLTFDQAEMQAQPPQSQTVASTGMATNAIDTLASTLQLQVTALGLPLLPGVSQILTGALAAALAPVLTSLDSLVDPILATAGVQVGYITVTANGTRCGVSTLVF
jgi:uncharacterized membrane protein